MKKLMFLLVIICTLTLTACRENAESSETSLQTGVVQQSDINSIQVYSCYVNDFSLETEGYVLYIQTPDDTSTIFPVKDYLIDKNDESLYMLWGINTFERIQGVSFKDGERGKMLFF